jgi:hypothetical protein
MERVAPFSNLTVKLFIGDSEWVVTPMAFHVDCGHDNFLSSGYRICTDDLYLMRIPR